MDVEKNCRVQGVFFHGRIVVCAIETSNPSKLQAPRPRNTFDLSTSILPPVWEMKFQEMAGDVTESYEWSATPRVMALKRMRLDTLAVL